MKIIPLSFHMHLLAHFFDKRSGRFVKMPSVPGSTSSFIVYDRTGFGRRLRLLHQHREHNTVHSRVTGQTQNLHVVGEYDTTGGIAEPLFGKVLVDDSVVQTLSVCHPSFVYALHLDMNQRHVVFERLHTSMPTAQLYSFNADPSGPDTQPGYSRFTGPYPANLWDYDVPGIVSPSPFHGKVAIVWALLIAIIIVLNRETRTRIDYGERWNRRR